MNLLLPTLLLAAVPPSPVIIDTDAGTDDLLAISFLLARPGVQIEAITVVSGLAHVHAGAMNILRLLDGAGKRNIPVYEGPDSTPPGGHDFPADWRKQTDELPGVKLPKTTRKPEQQPASEFLAARLRRPVTILALGPLTNIAAALENYPAGVHSITEMLVMGGAVRVPGNLADGGIKDNTRAEWNIFGDPLAAKKLFASGVRLRLIPLDATNKVPIDMAYLKRFRSEAGKPLGKLAGEILGTEQSAIQQHIFYAWDPLAAVAMVNPEVATYKSLALSVHADGWTEERSGEPANATVALDADSNLFHKLFLAAFNQAR